MTNREEWAEKSFQVFTDEYGVLRSGYYPTGNTITGNVQVDRVWGNMPMQPNVDRSYAEISFGGGAGDVAWSSAYQEAGGNLTQGLLENNTAVQGLFNINPKIGTDSNRVTTGYSNFPGYLENYAGDGDSGLETIIPNLVRLTRSAANALLDAAKLDYYVGYHNLEVNYIESTGKTVRVSAYNDNWNNWGGYAGAELNGLRVGDEVSINSSYDGTDYDWTNVKVTAISVNGTDSWFDFEEAAVISPALGVPATGSVFAGDNLVDLVTLQRSNHAAGTIVNEGFEVHYRSFTD